jgi:hypothetical protein
MQDPSVELEPAQFAIDVKGWVERHVLYYPRTKDVPQPGYC